MKVRNKKSDLYRHLRSATAPALQEVPYVLVGQGGNPDLKAAPITLISFPCSAWECIRKINKNTESVKRNLPVLFVNQIKSRWFWVRSAFPRRAWERVNSTII